MKARLWIVLAVVVLWGALVFLAFHPSGQPWGEVIRLYDNTDGADVGRCRVRLIQYVLISLGGGVIAWRIALDRGGRLE